MRTRPATMRDQGTCWPRGGPAGEAGGRRSSPPRAGGRRIAAGGTGGRGGWKPFLHHVSRGKPYRGRAITLKAPKKLPRILTVAETQAILDACTRLRDRFFFALMHETGCRNTEEHTS